jgi:hypothetical protein
MRQVLNFKNKKAVPQHCSNSYRESGLVQQAGDKAHKLTSFQGYTVTLDKVLRVIWFPYKPISWVMKYS